jgi:diguanylate cyclase (GGDEF)-like protein
VVLADDDRISRDLMVEILRSEGYAVEAFQDGQQAVERVARGGVDLVLLDIMMPRLNGLEACRLLKGMTSDGFLPVVLVTVKTDTTSRMEGLRIGADDYVNKPFDQSDLLARVEAMLRIKKLHDHVAQARAKLEQLSVVDALTGLYNYRYLHRRLEDDFRRAERFRDPVACLVLDVDRLQLVNQAGGRAAGDRVLCAVADVLQASVQERDVVARFGGDEFLVILHGTHFAGSVAAAERIWRHIRVLGEGELSGVGTVSASVGVALYPSRDIRTKDGLLRGADAALQQAKRDGGDRVCVFQQRGYVYTPAAGAADAVDAPLSESSLHGDPGREGAAEASERGLE